jgi:RNA methyltransferase, TrmH family
LKSINSTSNPYIKHILSLQSKARERKQLGRFIAEGLNELRLGSQNQYNWEAVLFNPELITATELVNECHIPAHTEFIEVSAKVFEKIAYRGEVKNAIGVGFSVHNKLNSLKLNTESIILVAEGIEKPGNLGAIFRTADAMNVDAVLLANSKVDIYNPNVIRSSVGTVFTVPIFETETHNAIDFLKNEKVDVFTTFMDNSVSSWSVKIPKKSAVVVGTENSGLTDAWRIQEFTNINIPMFGKVDSLNVSVAVSLLLYEFRRQKNLNNTK